VIGRQHSVAGDCSIIEMKLCLAMNIHVCNMNINFVSAVLIDKVFPDVCVLVTVVIMYEYSCNMNMNMNEY